MEEQEALNLLFAAVPEFAAEYRAKNEDDDDWAYGAWAAFGSWGFAGFVNGLLEKEDFDSLLRRCFEIIEELARDEKLGALIEVGFLESLDLFPASRLHVLKMLGPITRELLEHMKEGWRQHEESIAVNLEFRPYWQETPELAVPLGPLEVVIRRAEFDEVRAVLLILTNAGTWLHSMGITEQWPATFHDKPEWQDRFDRWTREGRVFVADGGLRGILGCFRLMDADDAIWGASRDSALYLHSLAVVRYMAGEGVAKKMLDTALRITARRGCDELRLDCWAGNERLRRYYLHAGFEFRGEAAVHSDRSEHGSDGTYSVAKFAKRVAS
jgi:ribosomal protein S18 acetylase RimI-like enzyme